MTSLDSQQSNSISAFITALSQQDDSLPSGLEQQLHAIGQNLQNRAVELPVIAASIPGLNKAYQSALTDAQNNAGQQGATLVSTNQDDDAKLYDQAAQIFTAPDSVKAAQTSLPRQLGQIASNPLKRFFGRG